MGVVQALLDAKGRKQAALGGDRYIGSKLPELFFRLGFGLVRQDAIPLSSNTIGWNTCWSVAGPIILLSGADSGESVLVDKAKTWFEENRENKTAIMSSLIFMVSASNMVQCDGQESSLPCGVVARTPLKGAWNDPIEGLFPDYKPHGPFEIPPLPEGSPTLKASTQTAPEFLIEQVRKYPHQVTIIAAGPHTNLALACRLDPAFPSLAQELIFMGGLIATGFSKATGNPDFASDFNLLFDPEAAEIAITADWPKVTSVGDVTNETMFSDALVQRIAQVSTPLTRYIAKYAEKNGPLWDELTVAVFLDPTLVTKQTTVLMDVDLSHGPGYGSVRIWGDAVAPHSGERRVVVIQDVDVSRFVDMFVHAMQTAN